MLNAIKHLAEDLKKIKQPIKIISHHDADGITAAAILTRALQRADFKFYLKIIKQLDRDTLKSITKTSNDEILFFLDLGSSVLEQLSQLEKQVFVLDHHEIQENHESNVRLINSYFFKEEISASGLAYFFAKAMSPENKDLADLAVIGMIGDMLEENLSKLNATILKDSEVIIKKGPLLFSSTRPLNKSLEFSSNFYIPGVTGSQKGVTNILREADIKLRKGKWPTLLELTEKELKALVTSIALRLRTNSIYKDIVGNIYLLKWFNRIEDARELSTLINACGRLGYADIAIEACLGNAKAKAKAENVYYSYKHEIIRALNFATTCKKIEGEEYTIINAHDNIKDTVIGTIVSIIAKSFLYKEGTIIIGIAHQQNKLKVSARNVGKNKINLQKLMNYAAKIVGGESGGHESAAGALIPKDKEKIFIYALKKELENEQIKIKI